MPELSKPSDGVTAEVIVQAMQEVEAAGGLSPAVRALFRGWLYQIEDREAVIDGVDAIDRRLKTLVVDAVNALPEAARCVKGRVRTGEEILEAIPDKAAFLREIDLMKEGAFFELNESGQLVMIDSCAEAYGLGENALEAKIRQTRIVYRGADGEVQVMTGEQYFKLTRLDGEGRPVQMEVSENARSIDPQSILMVKGLPALHWDAVARKATGEYVRMNDNARFDTESSTWVEDDTVANAWATAVAYWCNYRYVYSYESSSCMRGSSLGSRGVLKVNLNLES